jgi:hypothetical protein
MKTKIRNFVVVGALVLVGAVSANASVNFDEKVLVSGSTNLNVFLVDDTDSNVAIDYQKEAQMINKWIADATEAKVTQQIIEDGAMAYVEDPDQVNEVFIENSDDVTDFGKEAGLIVKAIADREEANAIQKLVDEGKYSESR